MRVDALWGFDANTGDVAEWSVQAAPGATWHGWYTAKQEAETACAAHMDKLADVKDREAREARAKAAKLRGQVPPP